MLIEMLSPYYKQVTSLLAKLFASNNARPNSAEIINRFKEEFLSDEFTSLISEEFRDYFSQELNLSVGIAQESLSENDYAGVVGSVCSGVQKALLLKFLDNESYLKPLSVKLSELVYRDDYGDIVLDDAEKEVSKFIKRRLFKILSSTDQEIQKKYSYYLKTARETIHRNEAGFTTDETTHLLFKYDNDISEKDLIENLGGKIFDIVIEAGEQAKP